MLRQKVGDIFQSVSTFYIEFKRLPDNFCFLSVNDNGFCSTVIDISNRGKRWIVAITNFLAKSSFGIFGKRIHIVFALSERHVQHKFTLRGRITPKSWKLQARKFPCVEEVDYLSTVNTISCETIRMPREDRICIALFNALHHFIKHWTTWNFGRLLFHEFQGDVQIFSLGKLPQFCELCLNTQNLLVLDISGLASIQKEFFIFHIIVHSDKNSFCISGKANAVKIA